MQSTREQEEKAGIPWIWRGKFGAQIETPNFPHQIYGPPNPLPPHPPLYVREGGVRGALHRARALRYGSHTVCTTFVPWAVTHCHQAFVCAGRGHGPTTTNNAPTPLSTQLLACLPVDSLATLPLCTVTAIPRL